MLGDDVRDCALSLPDVTRLAEQFYVLFLARKLHWLAGLRLIGRLSTRDPSHTSKI